jgi:CRP/FNR family transcriptional regulator
MSEKLSEACAPLLFEPPSVDWEGFLPWGQERFYPKGRIVYSANEHIYQLYYLKSGLLKQVTANSDGVEKIIGIIKAGNVIGEAPFFHGFPSLCTFSAITDSKIYIFSREAISLLSERNPEILNNIICSMSLKIRMLTTQINILTSSNASTRIRRVLHLLTQHYPQQEIEIDLTHQDIADLSGVHRVTVSRTLSQLRHQGILEYKRDHLIIHDKARFEQQL